jgi:hypothetical protein
MARVAELLDGQTLVEEAVIEFRGPAYGRRPTRVLGPVIEQIVDQQARAQNKRNIPPGLVGKGTSHPTEVSTLASDFPMDLPTLRRRMGFP